MAKKTILMIAALLLIGSMVFAKEQFWVGDTLVGIEYIRNNGGEQNFATYMFRSISARDSKPTGYHWDCLRRALGRYRTRRGEVYSITISPPDTQTRYVYYMFICEFTSDTEYTYWFFESERLY
jgi:hypothetical protein